VEQPVRTYARSMLIAFVTVIVIYTMVIVATLHFRIGADALTAGGYPALGELAGGRWLGGAIALGGMAGALGLFASVLLSVSRVPEVMARDRLLPRVINRLHPRYGTPYVSIVICSLVVSFMVAWSFEELIIIDVTLYGTALFLEFISLVVLRTRFPRAARPFRIPLPVWALCLFYIIPVGVFVIALSGVFTAAGKSFKPALFAVAALLSAEVFWQLVRVYRREDPGPAQDG